MDGVTLLRHAECLRREMSDACTPPFFRRSRRATCRPVLPYRRRGTMIPIYFRPVPALRPARAWKRRKHQNSMHRFRERLLLPGPQRPVSNHIRTRKTQLYAAAAQQRYPYHMICTLLYAYKAISSSGRGCFFRFVMICFHLFSFCSGKCPALTNPPVKAYNLW